MTTRWFAFTLLAVALVTASSLAQDLPRTPDGQRDIQGLWASGTGIFSLNIEPAAHLVKQGAPLSKGLMDGKRTIVLDPPDGILPYQPWALERRNQAMREFMAPSPPLMDPQTRGWPNGVPRANYYTSCDSSVGGPLQIMQTAGQVAFFYETHHEFRIVPLDGSPHPGKDIKLWMGASRGRWEGNTLVVELRNSHDATRFDVVANFHSDEMRITERWTVIDKDTLQYRATIEDPQVYTRPWTIGVTHTRCRPGTEIMEYAAVEGEKHTEEAEAIRRAKGLIK
jgi:hypothetical protein